jgi:hypothetical protein
VLLDFYNALGRAVRGRLDGADSMLTVNDALRDTFERFDLETTPAGVLVAPCSAPPRPSGSRPRSSGGPTA